MFFCHIKGLDDLHCCSMGDSESKFFCQYFPSIKYVVCFQFETISTVTKMLDLGISFTVLGISLILSFG